MSLESDISDTLKALVSSRCYPDVAPARTPRPYIVWQQVGGDAYAFLESTPAGKRSARIQVACWADSRPDASNLARAVEDTLIASALNARALGAFASAYDEETSLRGTRQDFLIVY